MQPLHVASSWDSPLRTQFDCCCCSHVHAKHYFWLQWHLSLVQWHSLKANSSFAPELAAAPSGAAPKHAVRLRKRRGLTRGLPSQNVGVQKNACYARVSRCLRTGIFGSQTAQYHIASRLFTCTKRIVSSLRHSGRWSSYTSGNLLEHSCERTSTARHCAPVCCTEARGHETQNTKRVRV